MYTGMCILSWGCMQSLFPDLLSVVLCATGPWVICFCKTVIILGYSDNQWWYVQLSLQVQNRHSLSRQSLSLPSKNIHHPWHSHSLPPTPRNHCPLHSHRRKSDFAHWKTACPFSGMEWETVSCEGRGQVPGSPRPLTWWSSSWTHPLPCPQTWESAWWSLTWAPSPPPGWSASWRGHSWARRWTLSAADWRENFWSPLREGYY